MFPDVDTVSCTGRRVRTGRTGRTGRTAQGAPSETVRRPRALPARPYGGPGLPSEAIRRPWALPSPKVATVVEPPFSIVWIDYHRCRTSLAASGPDRPLPYAFSKVFRRTRCWSASRFSIERQAVRPRPSATAPEQSGPHWDQKVPLRSRLPGSTAIVVGPL